MVIFSVPKTGSSAIDAALAPHADIAISAPPVLKHMPVYRFNRFMSPLFGAVNAEGFEKFAIVREPFDWLGSWYRYRGRADLDGQDNSTKNVSFDDFVLGAMKGKPPPYSNVGSQGRFLSGGVGEDGVDHLFQYEQMDLAVSFLVARLGFPIELRKKNVSPRGPLELSENTKQRYQRKRPEDFEIWKNAHRAN